MNGQNIDNKYFWVVGTIDGEVLYGWTLAHFLYFGEDSNTKLGIKLFHSDSPEYTDNFYVIVGKEVEIPDCTAFMGNTYMNALLNKDSN